MDGAGQKGALISAETACGIPERTAASLLTSPLELYPTVSENEINFTRRCAPNSGADKSADEINCIRPHVGGYN
jgi:hypothetical protein